MCLVLSKLYGHSREMWNISAMPNQSRYSIEPKSTDLIHFVNNEATLMNDLLLSKIVLIGHVDKREVLVKKRQLKTYAINANFLSIVPNKS